MRKTIIAGLLTAAALLGLAPTAHADITYRQLLTGICAYLNVDGSMAAFNSLSAAANHAGWPPGAEGWIVGDATREVCPAHHAMGHRWDSEYHVGRYGYSQVFIATFPPYQYEWSNGMYLGPN